MLSKKLLGAAAAAEPVYIEDVFSTYLYTGNGSTQTITNGIDLAGEGGLVWVKKRSASESHFLVDSARGNFKLETNNANAQGSQSLLTLSSSGFNLLLGNDAVNGSSSTYASWTFRKAEKFFDVVTYTGDGTDNRQIAHNLGSTPGFIILKNTSTTQAWPCYHRSTGTGKYIALNTTGASSTAVDVFPSVTSTYFVPTSKQVDWNYNTTGQTYVAYLFAHDAGGFGDDGNQNVISCGSYTGNGTTTGPTVNLGYEPQWILVKRASGGTGQWEIYDSMRGMTVGGNEAILRPNTSDAELNTVNRITPTATGFFASDSDGDVNANGSVYIYIAIRRGPMKTPEVGTEVFSPNVQNASSTIALTTGFPVDLIIGAQRSKATFNSTAVFDRLRGTRGVVSGGKWLATNSSNSENSDYGQNIDRMDGFLDLFFNTSQGVTSSTAYWSFRRAPGFFDVVCYTGTGVARTVNHNLGAVPELMIVKCRSASATQWNVYSSSEGPTKVGQLDSTNAFGTTNTNTWQNTAPTSTVFYVGISNELNASGSTYVAYLFSSCPGVSKVGSYTGTGTTQQIDCGFTNGARFVMIKRTSASGGWYVWDTARGIVAGNDPYLQINSTAAEVTNTDYIDTYSAGFEISSTAPSDINFNGQTFIFLAIA